MVRSSADECVRGQPPKAALRPETSNAVASYSDGKANKNAVQEEPNAPLAQMVEQLTLNQWVLGSSPRWCTKDFWTPNPVCGKWPVGQAAKTTASHAVNGSSILPRVTNFSLTWHRKCAILIKVFSYGKRKEERKTKARSAGHFSFADFSFSAKRKVSRCFL